MAKKGNKKSLLEKTVEYGVKGPPEIKKKEKQRFLGNFKERIIKVLTYDQIAEDGIYEGFIEALKDKLSKRMYISSKVRMSDITEYMKVARENNVDFTIVQNPDLKGDIGLVIVSDKAVFKEDIFL